MRRVCILLLLFVGSIIGGCTKSEKPIINPVADTYEVNITAQSVGAGNIEFWLDGEPAKNRATGRPIPASTKPNYQGTLLKSKGERILELRGANSGEVVHTMTLGGENITETLYWNGQEIANEIKLQTPTPGHYGVILQLDTLAASNSVGPVDIEIFLARATTAAFVFNDGKPVHVIDNYTFGTQAPYFELPESVITTKDRTDLFYFRLRKAGTEEDYYPKNVASNAVSGAWADKVGNEYWVMMTHITDRNLVLNKTVWYTLKQKVTVLPENNRFYSLLVEYGTPMQIDWSTMPTIIVGD